MYGTFHIKLERAQLVFPIDCPASLCEHSQTESPLKRAREKEWEETLKGTKTKNPTNEPQQKKN